MIAQGTRVLVRVMTPVEMEGVVVASGTNGVVIEVDQGTGRILSLPAPGRALQSAST